jgi:nitrilase
METLTAICQRPPVLLDKEASMAVALAAVAEAASKGARLITFPEAFLPGYPTWVWRLRPGSDMALGNEIHHRLRRNAIDIGSGDLDPPQGGCRAAWHVDCHGDARTRCGIQRFNAVQYGGCHRR